MDAIERLERVPVFSDLSREDLARICARVRSVHLAPAEDLFREGDPGDRAYVVASGEVEIIKWLENREVVLAVRGADDVIGEMALLQEEPRTATVRARTPVELIVIPKEALDELLRVSPGAMQAMFRTLLERVRSNQERLRQSERMAQLGTLTAGVAHELNNPAAAVRRSAEHLVEELDRHIAMIADPTGDPKVRAAISTLIADRDPARLTAVARSDAEEELERWLADRDVPDPWELAPGLADAGVDAADLAVAGDARGAVLADAIRFAVTTSSARRLAREIAEGSDRLSSIVRALKSYSYLDQAPVQDVDVIAGLEDTLVILSHKTKGVSIVRDFAPDLPTVTAVGGELNQVWTNLIDNACDAVRDVVEPTVVLRAYTERGHVVVEVEDNGPGIPPEAQDRIFDAFFTTKPPGEGTGLGLQISYRIVVTEHGGDLTVDSVPGRTTFRVAIPVQPTHTEQDVAEDPETGDDVETVCEHLTGIEPGPRPEGGCEECLAVGDTWVHLRFCTTCGKIGCCDSSKNRHATRHARSSDHPVFRTREPGEEWAWCVEHEMGIEL